MSLKIVKPSEPILTETLFVTLYGQPGIGKTSTAFTAKEPLLLDFDGGAQRAYGRKDVVRISHWDDVATITKADVEPYSTIIIDTVGRALEYLAASLTLHNPKLKRSTGELTMQGYGALKAAYSQWISQLRTFGCDVIFLAHEKEEKNGDDTITRIDASGSTRTEVVRLSDLVGFMFADGNSRILDFNPTSSHTGKNSAGFDPLLVPHFAHEPKWFAAIIGQAKETMNALSAEQKEAEKEFSDLLHHIELLEDAEGANMVLSAIAGRSYERAAKSILHKRAKALGLVANKETHSYEAAA